MGAVAAQFVDYDNDGLLDAFLVTAKGLRLLRNLGDSWSDMSAVAFSEELRTGAFEGAALGIADLDGDGDPDAIIATPQHLRVLENRGGNRNHSYALKLRGRVTNRDGVGAKVEIRAGSLRQKLETSAAVPMAAPAEVAFGLGARQAPDAVRVIWVSGIVQTEVPAEGASGARTGRVELVELDRKPSSCPYLYAWNGDRFEFVTDFLGGGEMGYRLAPGVVGEPDPVEYVRIAPGRLRPRQGRYELRVTNELEEVLYLDRLRLLAIDHPEDVLVFPNEGMTTPPKAERLFAARDPRTPRAFDHRGRDVTERLRARRPGLRRRAAARADPRLRAGARAHVRPVRSALRRTRCCCSPAGPTTPSRATTWPPTRPASGSCRRGSRWSARTARGRRRSTRSGFRSAAPRRSWWTWPAFSARRAASASSPPCG